jgi:hypothetical protein
MDKDRIVDSAKQAKGSVKDAIGKVCSADAPEGFRSEARWFRLWELSPDIWNLSASQD